MPAEFAGFAADEGCEDFAALAGFVKSCGDSVLDGTALRTGTAGPPGQPVVAVPTWPVVGPALGGAGASTLAFGVMVSSFWEYGVQPAFLAAAWASAVG